MIDFRLYKGIIVNYLHLLTALLSTIILTPVIIQFTGKLDYGVWVIFSSIFLYFVMFDLGLNIAVAKYTSEYNATNKSDKLNQLISSTLVLFCFLGIFALAICILISSFIVASLQIPESSVNYSIITFIIMSINVVLSIIGGIFGNIIYGFQRVDIWKGMAITQVVSNFFFSIIFLNLDFGIVGLALAATISLIFLVSGYLLFLRKANYKIKIDYKLFNFSILKEVMPYSLRSFMLGITNRLINYTDYIVIGFIIGSSSVMIYEVTFKMVWMSTYLFSVISTSCLPKFSSLYAVGSLKPLKELYLSISKISIMIMFATSISLILIGENLINLWIGPDEFVGINFLYLFVFTCFFHATGTTALLLLQAIGQNRECLYFEVVGAVLNLVISIILTYQFGLIGVIIGTILSGLLTYYWAAPYLACKYINLPISLYIKNSIIPPLIIFLIVFLTTLLLHDILIFENDITIILFTLIFVYTSYFLLGYMILNDSEKKKIIEVIQIIKHKVTSS